MCLWAYVQRVETWGDTTPPHATKRCSINLSTFQAARGHCSLALLHVSKTAWLDLPPGAKHAGIWLIASFSRVHQLILQGTTSASSSRIVYISSVSFHIFLTFCCFWPEKFFFIAYVCFKMLHASVRIQDDGCTGLHRRATDYSQWIKTNTQTKDEKEFWRWTFGDLLFLSFLCW